MLRPDSFLLPSTTTATFEDNVEKVGGEIEEFLLSEDVSDQDQDLDHPQRPAIEEHHPLLPQPPPTHHLPPPTRLTPASLYASFSCCSVKMPTVARQAFSFVANLFGSSASTSTATQIGAELETRHNGKDGNGTETATTHNNHKDTHTTANNTHHLMTPPGTASPTQSNGSSDVSDESILSWEPDVYEKELVKKTWSDDFDFLYELGAAIYTYIFEHNPNTKQLFPSIHRHGENWKNSKEFRSQALKFVQTLSHAVKNLYHMDRLAPYLYRIGVLHVKYAKRGFRPEFWNQFLDAMEVSLTDTISRNPEMSEEQKTDAIRVWRRLAHYVISHMKRGYNEELQRQDAE